MYDILLKIDRLNPGKRDRYFFPAEYACVKYKFAVLNNKIGSEKINDGIHHSQGRNSHNKPDDIITFLFGTTNEYHN